MGPSEAGGVASGTGPPYLQGRWHLDMETALAWALDDETSMVTDVPVLVTWGWHGEGGHSNCSPLCPRLGARHDGCP